MFVPGMLVEISGLTGDAEPVPGAPAEVRAMDLNGARSQLVEYDRVSGKWVAASFSGWMITIEERFLRPLSADELKSYDFVVGPRTNMDLVAGELASCLSNKGFAVMKVFVADGDASDMLSVARQLEDDDKFSRVAEEFESGYLGRDGTGKTMHIDPTPSIIPDCVRDSPLMVMDDNFTAISDMLTPVSECMLGFSIYSRTNMLLRMPLADGDEYRYVPPDADDADAEAFLHLMHRRKLTLLQFVGPTGGVLKLFPKREGGNSVEVRAEPHTIVAVSSPACDYSYTPDGESLVLQTFILSPPVSYVLSGQVSGDLDLLGTQSSGIAPPKGEQISVFAMHCRYGGGSDGRQKYWTVAGRAACDGLTEFPTSRWDTGPYYDPDQIRGGTYTKHACFGIDGVDLFDNKFFEISPSEARGMDPLQRQIMEVSYMNLLEAGWDKKMLQREPQHIGHFVGLDKDDWMFMQNEVLEAGGSTTGAANAITANRFSYLLNLKGASMQIDTACSSSLVGTHVAKFHLRLQDFEPMPAAIINGVNLMLALFPFPGMCGAGMLSHIGRCFTFNSSADGYARGELCGGYCIRKKKYSEGGLACVAGTQANQDGRSASMSAPNGPAQEKCIKAVLRESGLTPTEIDCFECHGTGTSLGDPIEVGSFRRVMSMTERERALVVTSSKSNIAHGEGGAGLAGFFKCFLQVMHAEATSNVHLRTLNPHLDLSGFPIQTLSETVTMHDESSMTGVSSFGFGGTNAHGEAWGKNIMTSRGVANMDPQLLFQRKLAMAGPAEITMSGDDWTEWETSGMDPEGLEDGEECVVQLEPDGSVTWEKKEADEPDTYANEFGIQGTHNHWSIDAMEMHDHVPGLWIGTVTLGTTGQEQFQIIADSSSEMVYYPSTARCTLKAAPINGPDEAARDYAWLLDGAPGDTFTVEFFQQGKSRSIMWMKK